MYISIHLFYDHIYIHFLFIFLQLYHVEWTSINNLNSQSRVVTWTEKRPRTSFFPCVLFFLKILSFFFSVKSFLSSIFILYKRVSFYFNYSIMFLKNSTQLYINQRSFYVYWTLSCGANYNTQLASTMFVYLFRDCWRSNSIRSIHNSMTSQLKRRRSFSLYADSSFQFSLHLFIYFVQMFWYILIVLMNLILWKNDKSNGVILLYLSWNCFKLRGYTTDYNGIICHHFHTELLIKRLIALNIFCISELIWVGMIMFNFVHISNNWNVPPVGVFTSNEATLYYCSSNVISFSGLVKDFILERHWFGSSWIPSLVIIYHWDNVNHKCFYSSGVLKSQMDRINFRLNGLSIHNFDKSVANHAF